MELQEFQYSIPSNGRKEIPREEILAPEKEDPNYIFRDDLDEEGFPKIFSLKTQEIKMFLRIVHYYSCKLVWDKSAHKLSTLEMLLGIQFLEWYENLSVSSNLFTKELHFLSEIWNSIFEYKERDSEEEFYTFRRYEFQYKINHSPEIYGHLSFRHYFSEKSRSNFHNYINDHLVSRRKIQRKNLNHQSHFKRSSDHSTSQRRITSRGNLPSPRLKEYENWELLEFLELSPQERKLQLLGESSRNSTE